MNFSFNSLLLPNEERNLKDIIDRDKRLLDVNFKNREDDSSYMVFEEDSNYVDLHQFLFQRKTVVVERANCFRMHNEIFISH